MSTHTATMENRTEAPQEIKIDNPLIRLLRTHAKEMKSLSRKDICTPMSIEALFRLAKIWKQCKSTDEWIEKMWCRYTMEYYPAFKKEMLFFVMT